MSEKMVRLKIKVPERYIQFIAEYCDRMGLNQKNTLLEMVTSTLFMFLDDLNPEERVLLVDKYRLEEIYSVPNSVMTEVLEKRGERLKSECISRGLRYMKNEEILALGKLYLREVCIR